MNNKLSKAQINRMAAQVAPQLIPESESRRILAEYRATRTPEQIELEKLELLQRYGCKTEDDFLRLTGQLSGGRTNASNQD